MAADFRIRAIAALLTSRDYYVQEFAGALTSTGALVQSAALSGPGPSEKRACVHCEGVQRVVGTRKCVVCWSAEERKHACSPCPSCVGGVQWVDSYTGQVVAAPERRARADAGGTRARRRRGRGNSDFGDRVHHVDAAHRRQAAATSQHALTVALEQLRECDAPGYSLLVRTYCEQRYRNGRGPLDHTDKATRVRLAQALVFVSQRMPDEIVLPGPLEEQLNSDRRAAEARRLVFDEGVSKHEAARRLGVRRGKLRAMLARRD